MKFQCEECHGYNCLDKKDFLEYVKNGKWFTCKDFICKYKPYKEILTSLWLSSKYSEGMCFETQVEKDWDFKDGIFYDYSAGVYIFGSVEEDDDCIYSKNGIILENKMKSIILESYENKKYQLVTGEELDLMWYKIKNENIKDLPILKITE